jgi:diguanylate cyclase (GGDEF)-like protein
MTNSHEIKVLVVEGSPHDAGLMQEMLEESNIKGFSFQHEKVFRRAIDRLRENSFDIVLLDISLADTKGVESIHVINSEFPNLPIVALSNVSDEWVVVQAIKAGAQDCLVKGQGDGNLLTRSLRYAIERKQAEERLAYLAQYDHLTGLANRTLFKDRLTQALARADRNNEQVALMFLDLDNFKVINDTLGHDAGDIILQAVAERLKKCVRVTDTVARLGGDEFIIILDGLPKSDVPVIVAQKIISVLAPPFHVGEREVFITTSIGISLYPMDAKNAKDLLKYADRSMYRAKEKGCSNYQFYAAEMNIRATERLTFRSGLYHALDRNELILHYQPIVNLRSGKIIGLEALLRWNLPNYGLLSPDRFIDLAEETELIIPIGEWVIRKACESMQDWMGLILTPFRISVNISARQFRQGTFYDVIERILLDTELEPGRLELELTEGTLMEQTETSSSTLMNLKDLGVRISIDDFGTGYSSLSYLRKFPIDTLKIAQTFVKDLTNNSDDAAISKAIIAMAHSLRLEVIAEGVETVDQLSILYAQGCDAAQGYYLGKPIDGMDIPSVLRKGALMESTESPGEITQPGLKSTTKVNPLRNIA